MAIITKSYGAPIFDETQLTNLFNQISQLEVQEVAESDTMYTAALNTATASRLASQTAKATATFDSIKVRSQQLVDAVTTKSANSNAIIEAYPAFFTQLLRNFFYTDATATSAARALTVISNFSLFPSGADRYPATSNTARALYKSLATLFANLTYPQVYAALYPKG